MTEHYLRLRRDPTGLYDLDARHPIGLDGLADHVRAGGTFTAVAHDTGIDCTRLVLADLLHHQAGAQAANAVGGGLASLREAGASLLQGLLLGGADAGRPPWPGPGVRDTRGRERPGRTPRNRRDQRDGVGEHAD